jgi:hypothetical protein
MHNRNFIINMVINGEKAPAFSAKTLNLPPPQDDNTGRIIEHTRENYSQSREAIEESINNRIMPPDNLTVKRPGPAYTPPKSAEQRAADRAVKEQEMLAQGKQWPITGITPDAQNTSLKEALESALKEKSPDDSRATNNASREPTEAIPKPATDDNDSSPKKKRTRSRKRKSGSSESKEQGGNAVSPSPSAPSKESDPTTLKLR